MNRETALLVALGMLIASSFAIGIIGWVLVIRDRRVVPPEPYIPEVSRDTTLDATGIGDEELTLVRSFLARRDQLAPHARRTLAAELAAKLRPRVAGARTGLTDEGLLEQIAAVKGRR